MSEAINFDCPNCGQNIDAEPEMAGLEFPCPSCEETLTIPGEPLEASEAPEGEESAPASPAVTTLKKKCASCGHFSESDAVICIECGYRFNSPDGNGGRDDNMTDTAEEYLEKNSFLLTRDGWFDVPEGSDDEQQVEFLSALNNGREMGAELRQQFKTIQPLVDQEFDPLDSVLKDYYSLAILFNRDALGEEVAKELLMIFLHRIKPDTLMQKAGVHAGLMVGFQNLAAVVVRGPNARDMEHVARQFGPGLEADYLLPHNLRFLRADKEDGNLIQRTFSVAHEVTLSGGVVIPVNQSVASKRLEEDDLRSTGWQLGM